MGERDTDRNAMLENGEASTKNGEKLAGTSAASREERLAEALRENLRRRKTSARERKQRADS